MPYLYRLVSDMWHSEIEERLAALKVSYDYCDTGWRWYRISADEANKLPQDNGPYLPVDDSQGFGLYHDAKVEADIVKAGLSWTHVEP